MPKVTENTPLDLPSDEEIQRILRDVPRGQLGSLVRAGLVWSRTTNPIGRIVGGAVVSFVEYGLQQGRSEDWIVANCASNVRRLLWVHASAQLDALVGYYNELRAIPRRGKV